MGLGHRRFRGWAKRGIFYRTHKELRGEINLECVMIDDTIVQVHRKASGTGKGLGKQAIGRSRGELTVKLRCWLTCAAAWSTFARSRAKHTN